MGSVETSNDRLEVEAIIANFGGDADGGKASGIERAEESPFCGHSGACRGVVERVEEGQEVSMGCADFEAKCALPRGGKHEVERESFGNAVGPA